MYYGVRYLNNAAASHTINERRKACFTSEGIEYLKELISDTPHNNDTLELGLRLLDNRLGNDLNPYEREQKLKQQYANVLAGDAKKELRLCFMYAVEKDIQQGKDIPLICTQSSNVEHCQKAQIFDLATTGKLRPI